MEPKLPQSSQPLFPKQYPFNPPKKKTLQEVSSSSTSSLVEQIQGPTGFTRLLKEKAQAAKNPLAHPSKVYTMVPQLSTKDFEAVLNQFLSNPIVGALGINGLYHFLMETAPQLPSDGKGATDKIQNLKKYIAIESNGKRYTLKDAVRAFVGLVLQGKLVYKANGMHNPKPQRLALWIESSRERDAIYKSLTRSDKVTLHDKLEAIQSMEHTRSKREVFIEFLNSLQFPLNPALIDAESIQAKLQAILDSLGEDILWGNIEPAIQKDRGHPKRSICTLSLQCQLWMIEHSQNLKVKKVLQEGMLQSCVQSPQAILGLSYQQRRLILECFFEEKKNFGQNNQMLAKLVLDKHLQIEDREFFFRYIQDPKTAYLVFDQIQTEAKNPSLEGRALASSLKLFAHSLLEKESARLKTENDPSIEGLLDLVQDPNFPLRKEGVHLLVNHASKIPSSQLLDALTAIATDKNLGLAILPDVLHLCQMHKQGRKYISKLFDLPSMGDAGRYFIIQNVNDVSVRKGLVEKLTQIYPSDIPKYLYEKGIEPLEKIIPLSKEHIQSYLNTYLPGAEAAYPLNLEQYKKAIQKYGHFFKEQEKDDFCCRLLFRKSKQAYINEGGKFDAKIYDSTKNADIILGLMSDTFLKELASRAYVVDEAIRNDGYFYIAILNAFKENSPILDDILSQQTESRLVAIGKCPELHPRVLEKIVSQLTSPKNREAVQAQYKRY